MWLDGLLSTNLSNVVAVTVSLWCQTAFVSDNATSHNVSQKSSI